MGRYLSPQIDRGQAPDGTRVVAEQNLTETWNPRVQTDDETSYALGWFDSEYKGERMLYHGGNTFGFTTHAAFLPDDRLGIVLLSNTSGATVLLASIRDRLFELAYDLDTSEAAEQLEFEQSQVDKRFAALRQRLRETVDPYLEAYQQPQLGERPVSQSLPLADDAP